MSVEATIETFKNQGVDFDSCYAYAVFPKVTSAGVGIGGKVGHGDVFVGGTKKGEVDYTAGTLGSLGFENYQQVVFIQNEEAFQRFSSGKYEFKYDVKATVGPASAGVDVGTTTSAKTNVGGAGATGSAYINGIKVAVTGDKGLYFAGNPGVGEIGAGKYEYTAM